MSKYITKNAIVIGYRDKINVFRIESIKKTDSKIDKRGRKTAYDTADIKKSPGEILNSNADITSANPINVYNHMKNVSLFACEDILYTPLIVKVDSPSIFQTIRLYKFLLLTLQMYKFTNKKNKTLWIHKNNGCSGSYF